MRIRNLDLDHLHINLANLCLYPTVEIRSTNLTYRDAKPVIGTPYAAIFTATRVIISFT